MRQDGMRDLTMQMNKSNPATIPLQARQGIVTAIAEPTITVQFAGEAAIEGVKKFTSFTPVVGEPVWVLQNGSDLFAVGKIGATASGGGGGDHLDSDHADAFSPLGHLHDADYVNEIDHTKAQHTALGLAADDHTHPSSGSATLKAVTQAQFNMVPPNGDTAGQNHQGTKWNGSHFRWMGRILLIDVGRGAHWSTDGYYSLMMPADGTVITGYGGAANQTVVAAGIPITAHTALYAFPTVGGTNGQYAYGLVSYTADYTLPENAVFIAGMTENANSSLLRTGWGQTLDYWRTATYQNGWTTYDANYFPASYMKDGSGFVHLRGLIKGGTVGAAAFTLPVGFRTGIPGGTHNVHFVGRSSNGPTNLYINGAGAVVPEGTNTWWDLTSISPFRAEA